MGNNNTPLGYKSNRELREAIKGIYAGTPQQFSITQTVQCQPCDDGIVGTVSECASWAVEHVGDMKAHKVAFCTMTTLSNIIEFKERA